MKDVHFYRTFGTISYRGAGTDIQHTVIGTPIECDMNRINTIGRNQLIRIIHTEVGCRKSDLTSHLIATHHRTIQKIVVTQTTGRHIDFTLMQHLANDGRAYMKIITHTGTGADYLYAHLGTITAIVFETFTTVVPKAMVIADDECLHPITVS